MGVLVGLGIDSLRVMLHLFVGVFRHCDPESVLLTFAGYFLKYVIARV